MCLFFVFIIIIIIIIIIITVSFVVKIHIEISLFVQRKFRENSLNMQCELNYFDL